MPLFRSHLLRSIASTPLVWARSLRRLLSRTVAAPRVGAPPAVFSGRVMGTYYAVTIARPRRHAAFEGLEVVVRDSLERAEALMSAYRPDSDVGRFNGSQATEWLDISDDTARCLELALDIGYRSGGLLDVTAGSLVNLWGFGPGGGWQEPPDDHRIADARARVGLQYLKVRPHPPSARKAIPGLAIDLASIAKGFAVDRACEALDVRGVQDYCVEVGGEVRTRGLNSRGMAWQIAIESPVASGGGEQRIIPLSGRALATSGDYRIYTEHAGARYSHIIDPRTGRSVTHALASVTVADSSCARADAWATALMVAGPQAGFDMAVRNGLAALFLERTPAGMAEQMTPGFKRIVAGEI